eukprot:gene17663-biopygen9418
MSALAQPAGVVAASAPSPTPPARSAASHAPPRPHPLTPTFCAHCKAEGAANNCGGCSQRSYCSKECQTMDWKKHKKLCKKLQAMHRVQLLPQRSRHGVAPGGGEGGGGGGAAAAAGGRSSYTADEEDEIENPCPICLDNEDDAAVDGVHRGMCTECGQSYCGACNTADLAVRSPNCPTCRAPFNISEEEHFTRWWKLEHDRSPGRHTPAAQYNLGCMYHNGEGVEQDHVEAAKWIQKAAAAGYAIAQNNLGAMYRNGEGVEQDHVEAAKWFRKSAEAGNANAQFNLGIMYGKGEGVEQDNVMAAKWYRKAGKAAEAGDAMAQNNLGTMYRDGKGVEQDHVEAAKWYRKSAEAGDAMAQHNLGIMYATGEGVEEDVVKGVKWRQLAAVQGHENAIKHLDLMQQANIIPTLPLATAVTTILLTSANAAKYNSKTGRVVEAPSPDMVRPGIAFVLLDGEAKARMFKLKNLKSL